MKLESRFSFIVALATAFILYSYPGFAHEPLSEKRASCDGVVCDADRIVVKKEPGIDPQNPARVILNVTGPSYATAISFLPADIFVSARKPKAVETRYQASVRSTAIKGPDDGDDPAALAKKLLNPVSSLARISFRNDLDFALGADREGWRYAVDMEPVLPFRLTKDWNLVSRTRMTVINQDGVVESMVQAGFGDILQSFYFSPNKTEPFFWGAGAALLIPTATDTRLGAGKFGLGPTLVVGRQQRGWTYGALARHIWSVAGHRDRADVKATFIQPFVAYTTRSAWTYSLNTESTYDWVGKKWAVPIHIEVSKVLRFGRQPVSFGAGVRCWAASPPGGPQACGIRFTVTPLSPAR
jgi:hypothetical protein